MKIASVQNYQCKPYTQLCSNQYGISPAFKGSGDSFTQSVKDESIEDTMKSLMDEVQDTIKKAKEPVFFEYYPDKPNIKQKIGIRLGAYKNISQLTEEFYEKYLKNSIKDLRNFAFTLEWEKEGIPVEYPNCILIEDPSDKIADDLIKMTKDMSDIDYAEVKGEQGLTLLKKMSEVMDESKIKYEKTGRRTLLYAENFDKLCFEGIPFHIGEYMKSLMTSCADLCGTTIIFKTKSSYNFLGELTEPHRCGIISRPHGKINEEMEKIAKEELSRELKPITDIIEAEQESLDKYHKLPYELEVSKAAEVPKELEAPKEKIEVPEKIETPEKVIKEEIKETAARLEAAAKRELENTKKEINVSKSRGPIKKVVIILASIGALVAGVKNKEKILKVLKGQKDENTGSTKL